VEVYLNGSNARASFGEEDASDDFVMYYVLACLAF
jgi:hypothetical protein